MRATRLMTAVWLVVTAATASVGQTGNPWGPDRFFRQIRFSPDGRFVLAQGRSQIVVLETEGLTVRLRLAVSQATLARFTSEPGEIAFVSSLATAGPTTVAVPRGAPHLERWSVEKAYRILFRALPNVVCGSAALSGDGSILGCCSPDGTLRVVDTRSGLIAFERAGFMVQRHSLVGDEGDEPPPVDLGLALFEFSPDNRYMVARPQLGVGSVITIDLARMRTIHTPASVTGISDFIFLTPSTILLTAWSHPKHREVVARVLTFPAGRRLSAMVVPRGLLFKATDPDIVIIKPNPSSAADGSALIWNDTTTLRVSTGAVVVNNTPLLDVFGNRYVGVAGVGMVGVWEAGKGLKSSASIFMK